MTAAVRMIDDMTNGSIYTLDRDDEREAIAVLAEATAVLNGRYDAYEAKPLNSLNGRPWEFFFANLTPKWCVVNNTMTVWGSPFAWYENGWETPMSAVHNGVYALLESLKGPEATRIAWRRQPELVKVNNYRYTVHARGIVGRKNEPTIPTKEENSVWAIFGAAKEQAAFTTAMTRSDPVNDDRAGP